MRLHTLILLSTLGLSVTGFAQGESQILMMTGKVLEGTIIKEDSLKIFYTYEKRSGKKKERAMYKERVFSVSDSEGNERLIYQQDTGIGNYFSEDEMRFYIRGQQDALEHHSGLGVTLIGVPVTAAAGIVAANSFLVFGVPFAYVLGAGMPPFRVKNKANPDAEFLTQPAYVLGYERVARNKRLTNALISGLVGTIAGVAIGQSLDN